MKELTIEEKAKAYDEALAYAKLLLKTIGNATLGNLVLKNEFERMLPELKESEDERIRKELISFVRGVLACHDKPNAERDEKYESWIAWLEKQGETSPISNIGKVEQKPVEIMEYDFHGVKFIPKFAKGDIIKDKKRGEVSTIKDFSYDTGLYTHTYGQFPITIQDNYEIIEPKQEWSEEDEKYMNIVVSALLNPSSEGLYCFHKVKSNDVTNWFKSLKYRVQPQSQCKPSDELDEASYQVGIKHVLESPESYGLTEYNWKPSDEQIETLKYACGGNYVDLGILESLYKDLKKLREE